MRSPDACGAAAPGTVPIEPQIVCVPHPFGLIMRKGGLHLACRLPGKEFAVERRPNTIFDRSSRPGHARGTEHRRIPSARVSV